MFTEHSGEQVVSLLICGGFGAAFGLYLDLLTLLTPTRLPRPLAAVRDAVAVLIAAAAFFLLSLPLTAGRMRWYLFAGAGLGLWAYRALLHRPLMRAGGCVRRRVLRTADRIGRWNEKVWRAPLRRRIAGPIRSRIAARRQARRRTPHPSKKSHPRRKTFKKLLKSAGSLLYNDYE